MSRAKRLLGLLQILRRHRYPVNGATLAAELDISLRTLYRDIASLTWGAYASRDTSVTKRFFGLDSCRE